MRLARVLVFSPLVSAVVIAACSRPSTAVGVETNRNLITAAEIREANVPSAYDVIAKLRAHYLRSRGPNSLLLKQQSYATVFVDDLEYGALSTLRTIPAASVAEIRFLEGPEATTKFGSKHVAGIIYVSSRAR